LNNAELNRIDEMMSQNIQSSNEQNVNSVQYKMVETVLQMNEAQGELKGTNCMKAKGDNLN
jgi:hypothetical protein